MGAPWGLLGQWLGLLGRGGARLGRLRAVFADWKGSWDRLGAKALESNGVLASNVNSLISAFCAIQARSYVGSWTTGKLRSAQLSCLSGIKKNPLQFLKEYIFKVFYFRLFQVSAAGANAQGSGPNKKLAKRSAAESLLQIMGYSRPSLQPAKPALKNTNSNGSTASSSTSSTMSTSSITNGELKTTHSAHSPASKDKTKKVIFLFNSAFTY